MRKFGVKGKINLGFAVLFLLLMFSGAISVFELTRMRRSLSGVLTKNVNNLVLSRQLIEVVDHITYSMQELVVGNDNGAQKQLALSDSLLLGLRVRVDAMLEEGQHSDAVQSINVLLGSLHDEVSRAFMFAPGERSRLYFGQFIPASRQLMSQVDALILQNQEELSANTRLVEQTRYRTVVPGVIAICAGLILILLFNYFINYFFVNPLIKITRAVENTVEYGSPFKLNIESNDEIGELKETISQLALQAKKAAKLEAEANAKSFNGKKA